MEGGGISGLRWILKPAITTTRQLYIGEERKSLGKKKREKERHRPQMRVSGTEDKNK